MADSPYRSIRATRAEKISSVLLSPGSTRPFNCLRPLIAQGNISMQPHQELGFHNRTTKRRSLERSSNPKVATMITHELQHIYTRALHKCRASSASAFSSLDHITAENMDTSLHSSLPHVCIHIELASEYTSTGDFEFPCLGVPQKTKVTYLLGEALVSHCPHPRLGLARAAL
jgi:hypothetical protein